MTYPDPTLDELEAIRADGCNAGADLAAFAGECPYSPRNSKRHRSWMDGFSEGRVAASTSATDANAG